MKNNKMEVDKSERKRLYKSKKDRKIAGVCGGIADYLNMDSTIIRIIFLISLIYGVGYFHT